MSVMYPINAGPVHAEGPEHVVSFLPTGRITEHGGRSNPRKIDDFTLVNQVWSARIIVGFNVGGKPRWKLNDLIRLTLKRRPAGATFLAQKGVWKAMNEKTGKVETESEGGGQVIMMNLPPFNLPSKKFRDECRDLARYLREVMKQDTVIYEEQLNGISQGIYQVTKRK